MSKKGIIFDLDGTLWSTTETIVPIWNDVLKRHKNIYKRITIDEMNSYMGKTLDYIAGAMFPQLKLSDGLNILNECCKEEQKELRKVGGKLYPRLKETLDALKKKYSLYIVSNCADGYVQSFLDFHNFNEYFDDIEMIGRTGKSKGENIKLIINRNNLDESIYVGDTEGDFVAAQQAGIPFVYAQYGFGNVQNSEYKIDHITQLPSLVAELFDLT